MAYPTEHDVPLHQRIDAVGSTIGATEAKRRYEEALAQKNAFSSLGSDRNATVATDPGPVTLPRLDGGADLILQTSVNLLDKIRHLRDCVVFGMGDKGTEVAGSSPEPTAPLDRIAQRHDLASDALRQAHHILEELGYRLGVKL